MQDAYESEVRIAAAESTRTLSRRYALMETRATLRPGDRGTRKLTERFGKRLVCVRYRYDAATGRRFTAVELVVAEAAWKPRARKARANRSPDEMVYVRVGFGEEALRAKMKALGAIWRPQHKLWELPWGVVRGLGIEDRVVGEERRGI
jgi:hypothetical protein